MTDTRTHCINSRLLWRRASCSALPLACLCALAFLAPPARAQEFGTLFTTPEEREYLDYLREENLRLSQQNNFNIQEAVIPDIPVVEEETEDSGPAITLYQFGGIMERRNGGRLVWLNGSQIPESGLPDNMALVEADGATLLSIRADGSTFRLKPGQTADLVANRVLEPFQQASAPPQTAAPDTTQPAQTAPAQSSAQEVIEEDETAAIVAADDGEQAQSDLAEVLGRLEADDNGGFSDEQVQQALDILTEQANTTE